MGLNYGSFNDNDTYDSATDQWELGTEAEPLFLPPLYIYICKSKMRYTFHPKSNTLYMTWGRCKSRPYPPSFYRNYGNAQSFSFLNNVRGTWKFLYNYAWNEPDPLVHFDNFLSLGLDVAVRNLKIRCLRSRSHHDTLNECYHLQQKSVLDQSSELGATLYLRISGSSIKT